MKKFGIGLLMIVASAIVPGCGHQPKPYGEEQQLFLPGEHRLAWAIAPTINISGQSPIDPLLQSDLVYQQLQQVHGLTVIPVDRVVEAYASLKINRVESERQAYAVCQILGCDGLVIPTVTAYDPYDPPIFGASLQLFVKPGTFNRLPKVDPRALERSPTASALPPMPAAKVITASGAVVLIDAVGEPIQGSKPSRLQKRMKKNSVRINGKKRSASWRPMAGRTTSSRMNIIINSKRFAT